MKNKISKFIFTLSVIISVFMGMTVMVNAASEREVIAFIIMFM